MKSRKFIQTKKSQEVDIGSILVAQPFWQDERYRRSVIIIINHDNAGSTGIILNKPTTLLVREALPVISTTNIPLHFGGPFDTHTVSFIHNNPEVPEAIFLGNDLYWGGNFEYLGEAINKMQIDLRNIKFFAGFTEWNAGQLEAEISENKWWTSDLLSDELFNTSADDLWSHELLSSGHIYGIMNELADPSLN